MSLIAPLSLAAAATEALVSLESVVLEDEPSPGGAGALAEVTVVELKSVVELESVEVEFVELEVAGDDEDVDEEAVAVVVEFCACATKLQGSSRTNKAVEAARVARESGLC